MFGRERLMPRDSGIAGVLVASAILLMQFVNLSFLADTGKVGTLFVLAFATFGLGSWFLSCNRYFLFSTAHGWSVVAWLLLFAGSFQAVNQTWSLLFTGIASVYFFYFLLITHFARTEKEFADKIVDVFLLFGLLAALLGLYEYISFHLCGPTHSPLIPYLLPPDLEGRVAGPYGQPNFFALFLTLTILAYMYRHLHVSLTTLCRAGWISRFRFLPVLVVSIVFFLTRSKGGFLSLCLIVGFMLWLVVSKRYLVNQRKPRKEFFLVLCCLGVCFLLSEALLLVGVEEVVATRSFTDVSDNPSGRFVFWTSAILIFFDHAWLGVGLDNYRFLMNGYGPASHDVLGFVPYEAMKSSFWAHNEFLQLLCEGGVFFFCLIFFFVIVFVRNIWRHFIRKRHIDQPLFLYSHLFLLPFLIQAQFSWPLRHPAILLLFVTFTGMLVSQYTLRTVRMSDLARGVTLACLIGGLMITINLFVQEQKIMAFKQTWLKQPLETTVDEFAKLVEHPLSSYRLLHNTLPRYTVAALSLEDDTLAQTILPYSERLVHLEGAAGQWYDLSRLYLRLDRLEDAQFSIAQAFELKPTNTVVFDFLHHLNVLQASRATGQPVENFYPAHIKPDDFNFSESVND